MTTNTVTTTTTEISLAKLIPCLADGRHTGAGVGYRGPGRIHPGAWDRHEVVAGGRRLAALKLLAKQKRITRGIAIPRHVLDADGVDVAEASLGENIVRQDMHAAVVRCGSGWPPSPLP
jgi:hypothetical protein